MFASLKILAEWLMKNSCKQFWVNKDSFDFFCKESAKALFAPKLPRNNFFVSHWKYRISAYFVTLCFNTEGENFSNIRVFWSSMWKFAQFSKKLEKNSRIIKKLFDPTTFWYVTKFKSLSEKKVKNVIRIPNLTFQAEFYQSLLRGKKNFSSLL